jgi:hypothetical protein
MWSWYRGAFSMLKRQGQTGNKLLRLYGFSKSSSTSQSSQVGLS